MEATKIFIERIVQKCEIDEYHAEELCSLVFGSISKRLGYSSAVQFILQLPYGFQTHLLKSWDGPDRSLTSQTIVNEVSDLICVPAEGARRYIQEVWHLMCQFADHTQLEKALDQLPPDILELFVHPESPVKHDFEQWVSR